VQRKQLLQRPQVGVEENFFEVGGHSLLAMQLIARLRAELGADLSLRAIFEGPTIASIAARVAPTREAGGSAASLPAREPGPYRIITVVCTLNTRVNFIITEPVL
jgi:aryl carrier-like protein